MIVRSSSFCMRPRAGLFPAAVRVPFVSYSGGGVEEEDERHASDMRASRLGLAADTLLVAAKGSAGLSSGSAALTADAAYSAADVLSSAVVYLCVQGARAPADSDLPFGYGKIQSLGTLAVAGALLATGVAMGAHSLIEISTVMGAVSTEAAIEAGSIATVTDAAAAAVGPSNSNSEAGMLTGTDGAMGRCRRCHAG